MLIHKHGKKTYCNKKCRITHWQEKKQPHSDLKQSKIKNKASLPHQFLKELA